MEEIPLHFINFMLKETQAKEDKYYTLFIQT
jgi:hypothetical protein